MKKTAAPPDFIGIGAQKSGTTWLSRNLQLHPEVWMPDIKELHYFNDRINDPRNTVFRLYRKLTADRAIDRRWRRQVKNRLRRHRKRFSKKDFLWDLKYYAGKPTDEWYVSLFEPGGGKVKGEITPAYSTLGREEVARAHSLAPDAKLIFMMRNPIERAWSQAVMHTYKSGEKDLSSVGHGRLRRNFDSEGSRWRTNYLRTLENWGEHYPEEQIFVGFLEDVYFYPEELLCGVGEFLGVDSSFKPPGIGEKVHSRSSGTMPTRSAVYLARLYKEELARLDKRFGGYAAFWRHCADELLENPPETGDIPYPLWESSYWKAWAGEGRASPGFQSGPLQPARGG